MPAEIAVLCQIAARLRSASTGQIPQADNERATRVRADFAATISTLWSSPLMDVIPCLLVQAPSRHSGAERASIANRTLINVSLFPAVHGLAADPRDASS
jgi:hypothetical protein